jgi:hypothetical protein
MRGMLATHVTFSHCYPPLIYYLTERSLFKKMPPHGRILKKGPERRKNFLTLTGIETLAKYYDSIPFDSCSYLHTLQLALALWR